MAVLHQLLHCTYVAAWCTGAPESLEIAQLWHDNHERTSKASVVLFNRQAARSADQCSFYVEFGEAGMEQLVLQVQSLPHSQLSASTMQFSPSSGLSLHLHRSNQYLKRVYCLALAQSRCLSRAA